MFSLMYSQLCCLLLSYPSFLLYRNWISVNKMNLNLNPLIPLINTRLIPCLTLDQHLMLVKSQLHVIFQADIPLNVKQYKQLFTGCCQSSAYWDIDWGYRLSCPSSVDRVPTEGFDQNPNCSNFQHTWFGNVHYSTQGTHLPVGVKFSASSFRFLLLSPLSKGRQMTIW